MQPAKM